MKRDLSRLQGPERRRFLRGKWLRKPYRTMRRVEELLEDHRQDEWTKRRRTWKLKEWTGDTWLREKFGEIDRNGRGCARRPADVET
uniref:Uncharacterized protein n=1 Tax=Timema tahoe TaxID=61484 RepID=A0A7R9FL27_9NEOP|nr:unnamed protein product [Timema tahoe]